MKVKYIIGLGLIVIVIAGYWLITDSLQSAEINYQFGTAKIQNIEKTVSATGTLSPVTTIEVGTQISGTIDTVMVDYNDHVKVGQVLAVLDTSLLQASVIDDEASVERSQALLEKAEVDFRRNQLLYEKKLISESDILTYEINVKTSKADLKSAKAVLTRALSNLQYAVIQSPIDGIVIQRNVEEGQTVAASLSTPTLFVIAQDLSQMKILAEVDESDIGEIGLDQSVRFEVATYPDKMFDGIVSQIRLQPTTISNVVTYTVVVTAENSESLLLPGMTATLNFIVEKRESVLSVPARALSFKPSDETIQELMKRLDQNRQNGSKDNMPPTFRLGEIDDEHQRPNGEVWCLDSSGQINPIPVLSGFSDGSTVEIVASNNLTEGMEVIVSSNGSTTSSETTSSQMNRPVVGPGGGPGGPPPRF
ncbi:MAG: efflux RND transporter periplasmic adaptor subunit [bacterium]